VIFRDSSPLRDDRDIEVVGVAAVHKVAGPAQMREQVRWRGHARPWLAVNAIGGIGLPRRLSRGLLRSLRRSRGASTGSQRCSLHTCAAYDWALGSRTSRSGPSRNVRLSQPLGSAAVMGRSDHCGNCDPTSRATRAASISTGLVFAK
jgi:hypothetical protein